MTENKMFHDFQPYFGWFETMLFCFYCAHVVSIPPFTMLSSSYHSLNSKAGYFVKFRCPITQNAVVLFIWKIEQFVGVIFLSLMSTHLPCWLWPSRSSNKILTLSYICSIISDTYYSIYHCDEFVYTRGSIQTKQAIILTTMSLW